MAVQDSTDLWEAYWETGDIEYRNALVERHMPIVYKIAQKLKSSSGMTQSFWELVSSGSMGLLKAVERYSKDYGLSFTTFAYTRIRGQILDDIRDDSWVPRSVFIKRDEIHNAEKALYKSLGRRPLNCELAEYLNIDSNTLLRWLQDTAFPVIYCIHARRYANSTMTWDEYLPDVRAENGFQFACRQEFEARVEEMLQTLDEREQYVMKQIYYANRKKQDVAQDLGVSPSRISHFLRAILTKLRHNFDKKD